MRSPSRSIEPCTCGVYRSGRSRKGAVKPVPPSRLTAWVRCPRSVPSCSRPLTRTEPSVRSVRVSSEGFCRKVPSSAMGQVSVAPIRQWPPWSSLTIRAAWLAEILLPSQVSVLTPKTRRPRVAAVGELDAVHGPGGVPGVPVGGQDLGAQIARRGPGAAVVVAVLQMRGAVAGDRAAGAVRTAGVVRLREPDTAGGAVDDRGRVAVGVAGALVDHLERTPGAAAVGGAFEHDVDVGRVPAVEDAALGERQQRALGGPDDRRDAEARVPGVLGGLEQHLLFELRGSGRRSGVCRVGGDERCEQTGRGDGGSGENGSETGAKT
ncbi:hypothetical protein GCM10017687_06040 [Streptomyces echinatus]